MLDIKNRFESKILREPNSGCWLWEGGAVTDRGYGRFRYKGKTARAHRVAYELYISTIPEGLLVLHKCDIPCCVNPDHLFLGTPQDNMTDKTNKGRTPRGNDNGNSKLTSDKVLEIRTKYIPRKYTIRMLANEYNISPSQVQKIIANKFWLLV